MPLSIASIHCALYAILSTVVTTSPSVVLPSIQTRLQTLAVSANTGEKPQSKVWTHAGRWWCVMPNPSGTWIWRLDNRVWTSVLKLSDSTSSHADIRSVGDAAHILLFEGTNSELASVQYAAATQSYHRWAGCPGNVSLRLDDGVETATIDLDSRGRMWLASDGVNQVVVRYSDTPYKTWQGPIVVATGISVDDISMVTALPGGKVSVFWSNQNTRRFGFRVHQDGTSPTNWSADEVPASQSALNVGAGMADDHMHAAVSSDGTLYVAVKTSYDTSGYPRIALLVRHPNGNWDDLYEVDQSGTRGIVLLNESAGIVTVIYTSKEGTGDILYKESSTASIAFGPRNTLIAGSINNATSTKQNIGNSAVIMAADGSSMIAVLRSATN